LFGLNYRHIPSFLQRKILPFVSVRRRAFSGIAYSLPRYDMYDMNLSRHAGISTGADADVTFRLPDIAVRDVSPPVQFLSQVKQNPKSLRAPSTRTRERAGAARNIEPRYNIAPTGTVDVVKPAGGSVNLRQCDGSHSILVGPTEEGGEPLGGT
jgi:hypothetical protein